MILGVCTVVFVCLATGPCVYYSRQSLLELNNHEVKLQSIRNMQLYLFVLEKGKRFNQPNQKQDDQQ